MIGLGTYTIRRAHAQRVRTARKTLVERSLKFVYPSLSCSSILVVLDSFQIRFQFFVKSIQASMITVVEFFNVCCVCVYVIR